MALQLSGGSYGLRQVSSSNKTVLLVKLTDSALKIIESHHDHPGNVRLKPSIQFQGNQGIIQIPIPGAEQEMQKFSFLVSNLTQSAGVDCLQQIRAGHTGRVECLGSVQQKITVNANDDSYDMTRQRMNQAKKQEQKTSTKVIKQPGSKMGKSYKKTGKSRIIDKSHNHHHPHNQSSKGRLSPDTRAPTPPVSRLTPTLMGRSSSPLPLPNQDPSCLAGSGRNKTKPMMTISSSTSQNNTNSQNNVNTTSAVAARPIWDRVTHLLALRPYKYPEIVLRLTRDKPPDKGRLQEILLQVASTRNTSGGGTEYCLQRNIYSDIDVETWPGYSDAEKKAVKKKLSEQSGVNENRKRSYTNTLSPPETLSESTEDYSNPTSKKQRVSHIRSRTAETSSPFEPDKPKPHSPVKKSSGISFGTTQLPAPSVKTQLPAKKDSQNHEKKQKNSHNAKNLYDVVSEKTSIERNSKSSKRSPHNHGSQHSSADEEDFLKKYIQISSLEQRDRYKKDFYAEYQEYLGHYSSVAPVSDRFAQLQRKLNKHEKGSDEYKAISRQVIQEYKKTKKNDGYHRERSRLQFLHRKLQHIKELVYTFDRHKLANRLDTETICLPTQTATKVA